MKQPEIRVRNGEIEVSCQEGDWRGVSAVTAIKTCAEDHFARLAGGQLYLVLKGQKDPASMVESVPIDGDILVLDRGVEGDTKKMMGRYLYAVFDREDIREMLILTAGVDRSVPLRLLTDEEKARCIAVPIGKPVKGKCSCGEQATDSCSYCGRLMCATHSTNCAVVLRGDDLAPIMTLGFCPTCVYFFLGIEAG